MGSRALDPASEKSTPPPTDKEAIENLRVLGIEAGHRICLQEERVWQDMLNSFNTNFSDFFILSSPVVCQFPLLHSKYSTDVTTCDGHCQRGNLYAMVKCQAEALRLLELPSGLGPYSLALVLVIRSSVVMRITAFSSLWILLVFPWPQAFQAK